MVKMNIKHRLQASGLMHNAILMKYLDVYHESAQILHDTANPARNRATLSYFGDDIPLNIYEPYKAKGVGRLLLNNKISGDNVALYKKLVQLYDLSKLVAYYCGLVCQSCNVLTDFNALNGFDDDITFSNEALTVVWEGEPLTEEQITEFHNKNSDLFMEIKKKMLFQRMMWGF